MYKHVISGASGAYRRRAGSGGEVHGMLRRQSHRKRRSRRTLSRTMLPLVLLAVVAAAAAQDATQPARAPAARREQFRVIYEWTAIDFQWASPADREAYLNTSRYIPRNVLISGINFYGENLFLTLPRMLDGVPATLATIPVQQVDTAPKLKPFPSWSANALGDCAALQFVQNVEIDRNGIMWILDNGRIGTLTQKPDTKCPPSIVLIDLKTGKNELERIPLPPETVNATTSYLNDLVVDNRDGDYAYITDNSAVDPGVIVFRRSDKKSWKIRDSKTMLSVPEAAIFRINGTTINLPVNIDGIALGPQFLTEEGYVDRTVYYTPLSSYHLYAINASILRNESLSAKSDGAIRPYIRDLGTKPSQTDGMKMDSAGTLFFGLIGNSTIAEWNTTTDFRVGQRTIARDPNYIQWVDRFTFDDSGNIYVVINRLYNFIKNQVSPDEVNYRILKSHTGTKSYIFSPDVTPLTPPQNRAATAPAVGASLMLLAFAHLLA
ncbi:dopaminechrome tautomerase-like [Battus philenor]|uniref:dopaminechrome tautomerase-like n=1 Tax=Battus philenor TaxID=42288 RepID=UPI0035D0757A